ncbi:MAG: hypothetical protein DRJ03_19535 [Chloroflexi bacterium]|nr:MAG: hypothetical protein DRJ03_19535 [Chloroflexota bacterium]
MSLATVWNKESTNYGANPFVRKHGTSQFEVESEAQAMSLISEAVNNPAIDRLDLELATGKLTWVRDQRPLCGCDECSDECDCGGCPGNDDEDFDINDPRR